MKNRFLRLVALSVLFYIIGLSSANALTPHEVLVIYNTRSPINLASNAVANYYAVARGIPAVNIKGFDLPTYEVVSETDYKNYIATPINNHLSLPENSHIKAIVLCYGVPSAIPCNWGLSVDSALTMLGNPGVMDLQYCGIRIENPYFGTEVDYQAFRDTDMNSSSCLETEPEKCGWKLNYMVFRLDAFDTPTVDLGGVSVPRDVKLMIDRAVAANQGGKFVLDNVTGGAGPRGQTVTELQRAGVTSEDIVSDSTSLFITGETNVIGYMSEHMLLGGNANNYTTWTRPFHVSWRPGGVAICNTNDGHSFRKPHYVWQDLWRNMYYQHVEQGKLTVRSMWSSAPEFRTDQYAGHQVVLRAADGTILTRATFDRGTSSIDLSEVDWQSIGAPYHTYIELRFPVDDPLHPDGYIFHSKTPVIPDSTIYDARISGITYDCRYESLDPNEPPVFKNNLARTVSAAYIAEGATGTIADVNSHAPGRREDIILPRYASGYTWAEAAYMGIKHLSDCIAVLGDPLMAPYATPPSVSITAPAEQATLAGIFMASAWAESAPDPTGGIAKVEFWLTKTDGSIDKLVGMASQAPFVYGVDSTVVPDGAYYLCAIAYENDQPRANSETRREIMIDNSGSPTTVTITLPHENAMLSDSVTVEASVSNPAVVTAVEFWLVGSTYSQLLATDTSFPFSCNLDTTVCGDGSYIIYAVAHWQNGSAQGVIGSPARNVSISNPGIVLITSPAVDGVLVSGQLSVDVAVSATGQPPVARVDLFLSGSGITDVLVGSADITPYSCNVDTSFLPDNTPIEDGIYTLRAVAVKADDRPIVNTDNRSIFIINNHTVCARISEARAQTDGTKVVVEHKVVSAGTSSAMDGAFYIAESDRSSGVRIAWTDSSIVAGKEVTVIGEVWNNASTGEREIVAQAVWVSGDTLLIEPLGMTNISLGGASPPGENSTNGITGGVGLYNIGSLVRVCGTVTYVGSDFVYIDDGSSLADGNALEGPILVPLDGSALPSTHPPVTGLRVYLGSHQKPGIGDYVALTGISSKKIIGANLVRCVRLQSQDDVTYIRRYEPCAKWPNEMTPDPFDGYFVDMNLNTLAIGSKVRMVNAQVHSLFANHFRVYHNVPGVSPVGGVGQLTYIYAPVQLSLYDQITVTGISTLSGDDHCIEPDYIYFGGHAFGAMSLGLMSNHEERAASGGPFRPWPYPTAEETLASDRFKQLYSQVGAIGWALSQPDGTIVDLHGAQVIWMSEDGKTLGLKEPFEPIQNAPQLVMALDNPAVALGQRWFSIDIVGGTMTTLPYGQRAIVRPRAVHAYTNAIGRYVNTWSKQLHCGENEAGLMGLWRVQIAP